MSGMEKFGPWAVVTGCSSGIGVAFVEYLAAHKLNVVLVARRESRLQELAAKVTAAHGIQTVVVVADLADPAAFPKIFEATASLDVGLLINNAGVDQMSSIFAKSLESNLAGFDLNARAPLVLTYHFGDKMLAAGRTGGIINVSSTAAAGPSTLFPLYAASKAFVSYLTLGMFEPMKKAGITMLVVEPGPVESEMSQRSMDQYSNLRAGFRTIKASECVEGAMAALGRSALVRPGYMARIVGLISAWIPSLMPMAIFSREPSLARPWGPSSTGGYREESAESQKTK